MNTMIDSEIAADGLAIEIHEDAIHADVSAVPEDVLEAVSEQAMSLIVPGAVDAEDVPAACVTVEAQPLESMQLFTVSWRSAASGIVIELVNVAAGDEADLLQKVEHRFPREKRLGRPGSSLGAGQRRREEDPEDSLLWIWQSARIV